MLKLLQSDTFQSDPGNPAVFGKRIPGAVKKNGWNEENHTPGHPGTCLIFKDLNPLVSSNEFYDRAGYIDQPYPLPSQQVAI